MTALEENVSEGRQDTGAPKPPLEESNPIPVQQRQGWRLWIWIAVVAVIFVIIGVVVLTQ